MSKHLNFTQSYLAIITAYFIAFTTLFLSIQTQTVYANSENEGTKSIETTNTNDFTGPYEFPLEPEFFAGGDGVGGL